MSVSEYISALAPAYASDSRIGIFTNLATKMTSRDRFGDNYEYAVALRVAHMIARNPSTQPGAPGAVTSASEGGVSQSYSVPKYLQEKYGDLCTTAYGAQLAQLIEGNVVGHLVIGGGGGVLTDLQGDGI
jgi:hypothetical protein